MAAAIGVRSDYTSADLRRFARRSGDPDQVRRLLAVALILDGGSRSEAAKVAGVTLQIVRDWNQLVDQPWRIMSIGLRQWAHRF